MRILHLDSGLSMRGGQWQALRLVEGLAQAGHSVTLLSRQGSPLLQAARNRNLDARPLTAAALLQLARQADLVHAHDARSHTLAALLPAAPLVVSRRVCFPIQGGLSRWKYSRPRHFIAVSNFVKTVLIEGGVASGKISVVYDGVPLLAASITSERILSPASSDPQKGADLVAEAARLACMPVHFSTDLEHDLADAGLFVYITHSEGLGSGVLMAMSAGVPVIASAVGGLPEIVKDGKSGLLTVNTPQQIAAAIQRLTEDPALARRLASYARQSVEERFSIAAMVTATERVYESC